MATRLTVSRALALARKHLGKGDMEGSARLALTDAVRLYENGMYLSAARRARASLAYSVGMHHADTIRVAKLVASLPGDSKPNPRRRGKRARRNPALVTFANPPRGLQQISKDVVEIRYKHSGDGQYYKHRFEKGQVVLRALNGATYAVLERVDGKPIISEY